MELHEPNQERIGAVFPSDEMHLRLSLGAPARARPAIVAGSSWYTCSRRCAAAFTLKEESAMESKVRNALSRWQNVLIEVIALLVIGVSALLTAEYFGFDSPDPIVKARAAVYAFGVDGAFYVCVQLARHYLFAKRNGWAFCFWLLWTLGLGAFTYHNNLLFAAGFWQLNPEALDRAGVTQALELHLSALIPVAIIVLMALIPRRQAKDERTPEQIRADAARELALIEAKSQARSARAALAGKGLRGTVGGFVGQALNLEERQAAQAAEEARRQQRELRRAERRQMEQIAHDQGLNLMEIDDLEEALRDRGLWPLAKTVAEAADEMTQEEEGEVEEDQEPSTAVLSTTSGSLSSWLDAMAVAAFLGITRATAKRWMEADWGGPYRIVGCRNFEVRRGNRTLKIRKAPLKSVAEVKKYLDAARHGKNGATPHTLPLPMEQS